MADPPCGVKRGFRRGLRTIVFTVYVLKSCKNSKLYVGFTSRSAEVRLAEHNKGKNLWSRYNRPFDIVHLEVYENKKEAQVREHYLKSGTGRRYLKEIMRARSSTG
jgi:putative endonuclease